MHRWLCVLASPKVGILGARSYASSNLPVRVLGGFPAGLRVFARAHGGGPPSAMAGEGRGGLRDARRTLVNPPRAATTMPNGSKDSMAPNLEGGFASKHFDFQDVDAERLTHFYWDRSEDGNPYQNAPDFHWMSEDEFEGDNLAHISSEDRKYLISEYL